MNTDFIEKIVCKMNLSSSDYRLSKFEDIQKDAIIIRNDNNKSKKHFYIDFIDDKFNIDKEKKYEVSIIILTYEPAIDKLFFTLESTVSQEFDNYEIILTDDGSNDSHFVEVINYLEDIGFNRYSIILHEMNFGTVKNTLDAVKASSGKYIKLISPGDAFANEYIISSWMDFLKNSGRKWSFGDAIYYKRNEKNQIYYISKLCNPQLVDCYLEHDDDICRLNYVAFDDITLGAAVLCERDIMLSYLYKIVGKVKYAEDNSYRIMVFDNIVPEYFPQIVIKYECYEGVSNSRNKTWEKMLKLDWDNTNSIMLDGKSDFDYIQKKISDIYKRKNKKNIFLNFRNLFYKSKIRIIFFRKFSPRMSSTFMTSEDNICKQ